MKYSLLRKTFSSLLLGLSLSAVLFCGSAAEAKAEETSSAESSDIGILQEGGLLKKDPNQGIMLLDLDTDTEGAKAAIADALKGIRTEVNIQSYNIPKSQMSSLIAQVINSNPQFFYYSGCSYSYSSSTQYVIRITFRYSSDMDTIRQQISSYEAAVQKILNGIQPSWSDLEKALYVNDYIAVHCQYDTSKTKHNAYDALVEQTAVCQGYALAYQDLMNRLEIPCEYVSSSQLNHAWNMIQIQGSWYHVDVTWNDPVNDRYGRSRHAFFLKSTDWFKRPSTNDSAHDADDYVYSGPAGDTDADSASFDSYFWNAVDSAFYYYNGKWYTNVNNSLKEFSGSSTGLSEIRTLKTLSDKWYVWGGTSSYWQGAYGGCSILGNTLYYAAPTSIQALNLATGQEILPAVFTLSSEEQAAGYIYGFYITDEGILHYGIAQTPNDAAEPKQAALHTHSYGDWVTTAAPTCTEAGERTKTCSSCGMIQKEVLEATGHTPGTEASCTEPQICTVCNAELAPAKGHLPGPAASCTEPQICTVCSAELAPAKGHTPGPAASCTEPQICTVCNAELAPAKGHTPGPAASCTTAQTCTVCGAELAPANGHSYDSGTVTKSPTCASEGVITYTCLHCDDSYTESIPKTSDHSFGAWETSKDSTCLAEGLSIRVCSVCGTTEEQTIPRKEHTPGPAASCTEPQLCTACGAQLAPANGHSYDSGTVTKSPTCASEGVITYTCLHCDDSYTESIPKTSDHSFGAWETSKDSTCLAEGLSIRVCSVCGATEEQTIPRKEHTPGPAASCTTAQTCTVCGAQLAPAKGHTPGSKASCTTAQTCTVCGAQLAPATGHTPGSNASCTEPQTCTSCGITLTEAAGHVHTETKVTKEATFLKTGKASVVCSDCGTILSTQTLAKVKCKKGQTYTVSGYKYKIVSAKTNGKGTVAFTGLTKKTSKVTIKDTVTILGVKFNVVQIGDRALKNNASVTSITIGKNVQTIGKEAFYKTKKLKTITIKSTKITKVGSNALKNTNAKAKIKVPKAKLKKYTTLFRNKGQKKTVKIY